MSNSPAQQSQRPSRISVSSTVSANSSDIYECRIRARANTDWVKYHRENADKSQKARVETHVF